jgi:hypothetical protein
MSSKLRLIQADVRPEPSGTPSVNKTLVYLIRHIHQEEP